MEPNTYYVLLLTVLSIPFANGAIPGTFFWKPRLGIDLSIPTTEIAATVALPSRQNVQDGLVVLVDGYKGGMTVVALASGISNAVAFPHMNPMSAYFYTNSYRWALRHMSLLPYWLGGTSGSYCDTHKVWRRRFFYMDEFVPKWLRKLFPYVDEREWEQEIKEMKKFKKFAEPSFGKHYRYPSKTFRNFKSQETTETIENLDSSTQSGYGTRIVKYIVTGTRKDAKFLSPCDEREILLVTILKLV